MNATHGTLAAIARQLASPELDARRAALDALAARAMPLDARLALAVAACLAGPRKDVQRRAVDVLRCGQGADHEVVLEALRVACAADDPVHRWGAAYALGHLGRFESVTVPPLLEALGQSDGDQRWAAAQLLVANGETHAGDIVPLLLQAFGRPEPLVRKMVVYVVRDLGLDSGAVRTALVTALRDPDVGVRLAGLSAVLRLDPLPPVIGELVLAMAIEDESPGARRAAVSALGSVGLGVAAVAPVLAAAAVSTDGGLRRAALAAQRRRDDG